MLGGDPSGLGGITADERGQAAVLAIGELGDDLVEGVAAEPDDGIAGLAVLAVAPDQPRRRRDGGRPEREPAQPEEHPAPVQPPHAPITSSSCRHASRFAGAVRRVNAQAWRMDAAPGTFV